MTSRERVAAAARHRTPDRIPVDFGGHRSSGIMAQAYKRLREYLGLPQRGLYVYDFIQQLALVEDDVLDIVGADVVELGHDYINKPEYWQDWCLPDGTPCKVPAFIPVKRMGDDSVVHGDHGQVICIQKAGCLYFEQTCFPYLGTDETKFDDLQEALKQIMWCRLGIPPTPATPAVLRETARELRASTDRAIYATSGGNLVEIGEFAFRIDEFLCELAADPKRIHAFLDKLVELHLRNMDQFLGAVGEYVDIIGFGDDVGMHAGPQLSRGCTSSSSGRATRSCGTTPRSSARTSRHPSAPRSTMPSKASALSYARPPSMSGKHTSTRPWTAPASIRCEELADWLPQPRSRNWRRRLRTP
jgi:uroporphyrinogen decarboxylase